MDVTNVMEYNGHQALITYRNDCEVFRGEILGLSGSADFYSDSVEGLKTEFKKSMDTYLEVCEEHHINPYSDNTYVSLNDVESALGSGAVIQLVDYLINQD